MDAQKNAIMNAYAQVFAIREQLNAEGKSVGPHLTLHSSWQVLRNIQQEPDPIAKPELVQQKKLKDKAAEVWHHPQL
jgi:hypothetical protein